MEQVKFFSMGCEVVAYLDRNDKIATTILGEVQGWFISWEKRFSRFLQSSELSEVNRNAGKKMEVSHEFWEVLKLAISAYSFSNGLVQPTILPALLAAGYQKNQDYLKKNIRVKEKMKMDILSPELIDMDENTRSITIPEGMMLDFGGIVKGWAAQEALKKISKYGPALVNAGGDIAVGEPRKNGTPWQIGIENPFCLESDIETLGITNIGVATSGSNRRHWQKNGEKQHHIIDPRTGKPAETDLVTATVLAPSVVDAETAAKTVFILGSKLGMEWIEEQPEIYGMVILETKEVMYDSKLSQIRSS
jgi:FAD:protein FMN transferase